MPLQLCWIEIDFTQIARAVSFRLIVEMLRRRIAAFTAGGDCDRANFRTELNHSDKAVAAGAVNLFRPFVWPRSERCQRSPDCRREANRNARAGVSERMNDVVGQSLKSIDIPPVGFPRAEVGREFV